MDVEVEGSGATSSLCIGIDWGGMCGERESDDG